MLNRLYPLRKCETLKKDYCLYYHIGECLGYCKNEIDLEKLETMKKEITSFLNGDAKALLKKLNQEMELASSKMNFEKALEYKKMIDDINITLKNQTIVLNKEINLDLFNYYVQDNYLSIQVFFIRSGTLFGRDKKIFTFYDSPVDTLVQYIINFYEKHLLPKEILVPSDIDTKILTTYLKTNVRTPLKGDMKKLLDLAYENAKILLEEEIKTLNQNEKVRKLALKELAIVLNQKNVSRIEGF